MKILLDSSHPSSCGTNKRMDEKEKREGREKESFCWCCLHFLTGEATTFSPLTPNEWLFLNSIWCMMFSLMFEPSAIHSFHVLLCFGPSFHPVKQKFSLSLSLFLLSSHYKTFLLPLMIIILNIINIPLVSYILLLPFVIKIRFFWMNRSNHQISATNLIRHHDQKILSWWSGRTWKGEGN